MELIFNKLDMSHRSVYEELLAQSGISSSHYSFLALWAWRNSEKTEICFDEREPICWLKNRRGIISPICPAGLNLVKILSERSINTLYNVPESAALQFADKAELEEIRSEWEYIYRVQDLVELKGRNFHQKRSHISNFEHEYNGRYDYRPILTDDFDELREFQSEWLLRQHSVSTLTEENDAINEILNDWDNFPLFGATLKINGKIAAYTIAEELSCDTLDIRFEKAFSEYDGIYQALNQKFLERQGKNYVWVNREEDMGDEGLRRAKSSYQPSYFLKKFKVSIKLAKPF